MSRQVLRALQPGMIGGEGSMGGSMSVKGCVGARLPQCCPEAFTVMEMSRVTCEYTGQHLTQRQTHFRRHARVTSASRFAGEGTETAS
jgi:hypothetical protein